MKLSKKILLPLTFSALGVFQSQSLYAAVDIFLKLEGINGESRNDIHKDEIDVLAWSWAIGADVQISAAGLNASAPAIYPISITKYTDVASPKLMEQTLSGKLIPTAILYVNSTDGSKNTDYVEMSLTNVFITEVSTAVTTGSERLTENVSLAFETICFKYFEIDQAGGTASTPETCYSVVTGE